MALHNLIPHFIHDQYQAKKVHGTLNAVTFFLDISGFTAMTQALMAHGKEGAEIISDCINRVFGPLIETVHAHGGFIVGFAGDAFTAVFPGFDLHTVRAACQVSLDVRHIFSERGRQQTPFGAFDLTVKQGLSAGSVEWGILGPEGHKGFFFRGPGIDGCAIAEHQAASGDIILDQNLLNLLSPGEMKWQKIDDQFAKLETFNPKASVPRPPLEDLPQDTTIATQFYRPELLNLRQPGEFRDNVSMFISFQDIADFAALDAFMTQLIRTVDRYDGYFDRVDYGDKGGLAIIFFGAPVAHENDIQRALDFALALQQELAELPAVHWRLGMTYGRGRAGFMGSQLRDEYSVIGSSTNLAARLMGKASWGEVLVSETIARQPGFRFEHLGDFAYKGLSAPVPTYRLLRKSYREEKVFEQKMVGRDAELRQLLHAAQPIFHGQFAGVATIFGEPGIGKSRLSFALREQLTDTVKWMKGTADQILRAPFNPFIYFLRQYFNQVPSAATEENKAAFETNLSDLISKLELDTQTQHLCQELTRTKSFLGALLGLFWPDSLYETLDARGRYENTLFAVKTLLQAESRIQPVVFELEDAHGLDEASHELLTTLTRQMADYPLFLILTSRYTDDGSPPVFTFAPDTPTITLDLNVLTPEAMKVLAVDILGNPMDDALAELLHEKTQANPFFAQQVLYYFQENDLLELSKEGICQVKDTSFELPVGITAILIARIDRLANEIKEAVKAAAVLGREFEVRLLSQMLQEDVLPRVEKAEQEQIWTPLRELQYTFKNLLLRDAAYEIQLRARLRELHRLAAEAYEKLYADELRPYYAELAFHYGQAQSVDRERHYATLAGEQAAARYANDNALRYLARAIELTPDGETDNLYSLLLHRESVYDRIGERTAQAADLQTLTDLTSPTSLPKIEETSEVFEGPLQGGTPPGDFRSLSAQTATVSLRWANFYLVTSDYLTAVEAAKRAIEEAQKTSMTGIETKGYIFQGRASWQQGDYEKAEIHLHRALELAQRTHSLQEEAETLLNLGATYRHQGHQDQAQTQYQRALGIFKDTGDKQGEAGCLSTLGAISGEMGDYVTSRTYADQALTICHEIGYRRGETILNANLGVDYYDLGDYETAEAYLERALSISRETGNRWVEALSQDTLGLVHQGLGRPDMAHENYLAALAIQREIGDKNSIGYTLTHLGYTLIQKGNFTEALEVLREALDVRRDLGQENLSMDVLAGLADLSLQQGKPQDAISYVKEILAWIDENGDGGIEYPVQVYLIGYRVLEAIKFDAKDTEQAAHILQTGYALLQERATRIKDETLRHKFLNNVPFHRKIMSANKI